MGDPEPFHPFKLLGQGLSEVNAHLVQVLDKSLGPSGKWAGEHSVKWKVDSEPIGVLASVEAYYTEVMNVLDPSSPTLKAMTQVYQTSFKKIIARPEFEEAVRQFLEDHVDLRTKILAL